MSKVKIERKRTKLAYTHSKVVDVAGISMVFTAETNFDLNTGKVSLSVKLKNEHVTFDPSQMKAVMSATNDITTVAYTHMAALLREFIRERIDPDQQSLFDEGDDSIFDEGLVTVMSV